jgi:hypothetical protein
LLPARGVATAHLVDDGDQPTIARNQTQGVSCPRPTTSVEIEQAERVWGRIGTA